MKSKSQKMKQFSFFMNKKSEISIFGPPDKNICLQIAGFTLLLPRRHIRPSKRHQF